MFEYDNEDDYLDISDIVTELNGGHVLPLIEEAFDYSSINEED